MSRSDFHDHTMPNKVVQATHWPTLRFGVALPLYPKTPLQPKCADNGVKIYKENDVSFLVTVTFDLSQAPTSAYPKIQQDLEDIDFSKFIAGRKRQDNPLPGNTFVAEFDNEEFEDGVKSSDVTAYVKSEIDRIFKKHGVSGRYFVAAGRGWSWKVGKI